MQACINPLHRVPKFTKAKNATKIPIEDRQAQAINDKEEEKIMIELELIPCPFCSCTPEFEVEENKSATARMVTIKCSCGFKKTEGSRKLTIDELKERLALTWNKRAQPDLAGLRKAWEFYQKTVNCENESERIAVGHDHTDYLFAEVAELISNPQLQPDLTEVIEALENILEIYQGGYCVCNEDIDQVSAALKSLKTPQDPS